MFKGQYDNDVTIWSPEGKLHQLKYAMEAVNQGSVVLGVRSKTHAVLCGLQRSPGDLASHQKKVFKVGDNMGIAISGLTADGRKLCKFMRGECSWYKYAYGTNHPAQRMAVEIADKQQTQTQIAWGRPFGVGLLTIAADATGPHLFHNCPSGNYYEYYATAIGSRSQGARTFLERKFDTQAFPDASPEELIKWAVQALKETVRTKDIKLNVENVAIAIVGVDQLFKNLSETEVEPYVLAVEAEDTGGDEEIAGDQIAEEKEGGDMDVDA